jgi:O-antigen/teichoic acid export membrane protein
LSVGADLIAVAILITPLLLFVLLLLGALSALGRFRARSGVVIAQGLVYLVVTWLLLAAGHSAMAVVVGQGIAAAAAIAVGLAVLLPMAARAPRADGAWPLRSWLGFGLKGHPGQIGQFLNYRLDALILGAFHGPVAVGFYAVATSLAEVTSYGANAVSIAAGPRAVRADGRTVLVRYVRITVVATIGLAVALGVVAPAVVPWLYGEEFRASVVPLILLLPGIVALVYVKLLAVGVVAEGRPDLVTLALGASLGATLILDFALIPPFGAAGAAAASTIAYTLGAGAIAASYVRSAGITPTSLVPRTADVRGVLALLRR